ncbi:methylaspartate mutase [Paractinoplanes deccanensis]|uniref:Methylaspartate mutase n=1 Tax=Paractinoplanes deccanensis TaxID=113561 RepID=A0ABQ3XY74_9ACTN|nr:cobalamin-dependent protein [Actinoplanes deccanensis]GID72686.1 methylaspartate mutase [Actinoplanes deccanensis]
MRHHRRILLSTVSSDAHTWNLVYLQMLLEEHGCTVTNLGPCVPDDVLVRAAREEQPDAIVISSVNGHGHIDGARVMRALRRDPGTRHLPAVIGGKLGIGGTADEDHAAALLAAGFDVVFPDSADAAALPEILDGLAAGSAREAVLAGGAR